MVRNDWKGWSAVAVLVAFAIGVALADRTVEGAPPPPRLTGEDDSFWWIEGGDQSAATLWLGPSLVDELGLRARHWTLVAFLPGSEEPLSCLQGTLRLDGVARIYLAGEAFRVEARPNDGLTWGDVDSREQLVVEADGFY
jgi:hypothetical protein